jgi:hypothetical protein
VVFGGLDDFLDYWGQNVKKNDKERNEWFKRIYLSKYEYTINMKGNLNILPLYSTNICNIYFCSFFTALLHHLDG